MTSSGFSHCLLTRFYLQRPEFNYDGMRQENWLDERIQIFERLCLPSVNAQTNPNFTWFLACREDVPLKYRQKLESLESPRIRVTFKNRTFAGVESQIDDARYLITTRLDNDDSVCPHFIERIQTAFRRFRDSGNRTTAFCFRCGYKLRVPTGHLFALEKPWLQYASLFVDLSQEKPMSVYHCSHDQLPRFHPHEVDEGHPAWMTSAHGRNIYNHIRRGDRDLGRMVLRPSPTSFEVQWDTVWECARHDRPGASRM